MIMWLMKNYTHSEAVALAIAHKMLVSNALRRHSKMLTYDYHKGEWLLLSN